MYESHAGFHVPADEAAAFQEQDRLRSAVEAHGPLPRPLRYVAGLDVAYATDESRVAGAVVVLDLRTLEVVDSATAKRPVEFPYIPGLLAYREIPALLDALARLTVVPEILVCDGYGLAHPRRFGLACHLGVLTGIPTFGVAKTPFIGSFQEPGRERGAVSDLLAPPAAPGEPDEIIGRVLRTQSGIKPVFISVGHRIGLDEATGLTLRLAPSSPGFRLPETTRRSDQLSRQALAEADKQ
ncbi:endonuclease V [Actinospica robiniae]|uniref:endonuclease V n=1 Tax=Actinospica robiniae TaxID=304901 RepID=UPI00040B9A92|nr:endonuclease V [Actinospica robiniae]